MSVIPSRSTFTLGREAPFPSLYGENKTPVTYDVLEAGWITAFFTLYFCYIVVLPAIAGKEKLYFFLRVTVTLLLGLIIVLCLFGQEWEVGQIRSRTFYKAGSHQEVDAFIGVKLGLQSVNITLKAAEPPEGDLRNERIDYNERFYWNNGQGQGRAGFGPFAAEINQEFRAAQRRGAPYPILWVAEYFTFDGEGLRFGRNYRLAGFYSSICIWTCFPVWIITIILFKMVIRYGAILLSFLGTLMLLSSLIWAGRRNFLELAIIFEEETLTTSYGVHWYLATFVGVICILAGVLIYFLDSCWHNELCKLFGIDPFNIFEEEYGDEVEETPIRTTVEAGEEMEMGKLDHKKKVRKTISYRPRGQVGIGEKTFVAATSPEYPYGHHNEYTEDQSFYDEVHDPFNFEATNAYPGHLQPNYINEGYNGDPLQQGALSPEDNIHHMQDAGYNGYGEQADPSAYPSDQMDGYPQESIQQGYLEGENHPTENYPQEQAHGYHQEYPNEPLAEEYPQEYPNNYPNDNQWYPESTQPENTQDQPDMEFYADTHAEPGGVPPNYRQNY